ncbi:hypothetical protein B7494_g4404 [Chlorociboria aeruginascens]|nr:hypothetical protein B7494_g4404 [Chlorociboria aeruginascens]
METAIGYQLVLVWLAVGTISYTICGAVYRLFLSPISHFPGPKLAALTMWYEFYYDIILKGQYVWKIRDLHKEYGPIVRINPYEIHINDLEFFDTLFSNDRQAAKWEWSVRQFGLPDSFFQTIQPDLHRMRRSVFNQYFSMNKVRALLPLVQERVDKLTDRFRDFKDTGKLIQLENSYGALANDVVMEYSFARHDSKIEHPEFDPAWFRANHMAAQEAALMKHFFFIQRFILSLPRFILRKLSPAVAGIIAETEVFPLRTTSQYVLTIQHFSKQIKDIRSDASVARAQTHPTVFHDVLESKLPPHEKTTERLAKEAQALVGAGTDTTSWALSVGTFYLLDNSSILRKLKTELSVVDPDSTGRTPLATLQSLPYLTAFINETLRLTYGVTHRHHRIFPTPLIYNPQWTIPPGTPVSMTMVLLNETPTIFPSPKTFRPERWIEDPGLARYNTSFSRGSRKCIGLNLALAELYTALAAVAVRFGTKDVRSEKDQGILEFSSITLDCKGPKVGHRDLYTRRSQMWKPEDIVMSRMIELKARLTSEQEIFDPIMILRSP